MDFADRLRLGLPVVSAVISAWGCRNSSLISSRAE